MPVINSGMRKGIKIMCVTCQTAQFISLMPKPKDFVTRIVGDVVLLSSKVQKLSDDINKLLDSYSDIPVNYLMTQVNTITGSLNGVIDRVNTYTQNAINQGMSIAENTIETITSVTETAIDTVNQTTQAVESLSMSVAHATSAILAQPGVASDIQDATEVIMEWTDEGFQEISNGATEGLKNATQAVSDAKNQAMNAVNDSMTKATTAVSDAQKWVENFLKDLKTKMDELSSKLDGGFKDVTGINSISKGSKFVTDALADSNNDSAAAQATSAISTSLATVLDNFSISKVITAFVGVVTQATIVKLGLDKLPPIDFESMLCEIRSDLTISNDELYKKLASEIDDIDELNLSLQKANNRYYSDEKYKEFVKKFNDDIKKQRDDIRTSMRYSGNLSSKEKGAKDMREKLAMKSAIKEVSKFKRKVKGAKQAEKWTKLIGDELKNLGKEAEYCCNSIKSDWNDMMDQYRNAIKEIKQFFQTGGDGDMFIDDCCDAINKDCDDIKSLCSNIGTQLIGSTLKVALPADIGMVFPNPIYKLASFWMDVKTIFKFIKDLITLVIDIINNINKLARIMLNGLNSLKDIIKQLMEMIGLKWFMDLIQSIINFFGEKISSAKLLLENTLTPVYYKDTKEYENILNALESLSSASIYSDSEDENYKKLLDETHYFNISNNEKGVNLDYFNKDSNNITTTLNVETCINELEKKENDLVAYKSPILESTADDPSISDIIDGKSDISADVKFIGWHFYHPNLNHSSEYYKKGGLFRGLIIRIKNKIIKKAAENGNKTNGGVLGLKNNDDWKIKKGENDVLITAYDAFYWYTYYTEDLEKDCFEMNSPQDNTYIDSVVQTQNGSIVQLDNGQKVFVANNNVRSGDYVEVNGVKYRVK